MKRLLYASVLILVVAYSSASDEGNQDWWKHAVFYQVYPRSFKDTDEDGVGDIRGITRKLGHFKDAGVDAIWLSPVYKSPKVDQGYDISDFKEIDEEYGSLVDFDMLLFQAHRLGIKVIMDLVPNHSSDQHEWFVKSENREKGYEDYYVWRDEPNNWISSFKGSAWTYSEKRGQYYYHQFAPEQPDLNYRNEAVVKEMKDIMLFWLDLGVDGFRIDAVANLFEDENFRDEPLSGAEGATENDSEYLDHIYTRNLPETYDMVKQFREFVDDYTQERKGDARIIMTEVYGDIEDTVKYYGTEDGSELRAHFTFNFQLITKLTSSSTARDVVDAINEWLTYTPSQYVSNWVLGNHDKHRVATRLGPQNVDGFNMLAALLPGIQVTYNGEEIGQEDGEVEFEQCADTVACKDEATFYEMSRDFERTPYQWDNSENAGFSEAKVTWLPVSKKYLETNLAAESAEGVQSHYHVYQDLVKLRKEPSFVSGKLKIIAASDNVIAFSRSLEGSDTYVCLFNMGDSSEALSLKELFSFQNIKYEIAVASVGSSFKKGSTYNSFDVTIKPHESIVIKIVEADQDWWKHAIFYQVYPRSFKDSNGDGIGDLKGITSKVEHFKDTGVDAVWLSPIFKSPQVDQGYDISDYRDIHTEYGTMEDFEELLEKAHELGVKVILDFVPNHCSDQHEWFTRSENREEGYEDFFVWKDPVEGKEPNNWLSIFKDSAWKYSETRKQYYLHQFAEQQPDLNYRSEALVKEMKEILVFWLDKGVDGFRVDAVPYLFEHEDLKDEPLSGKDVDENDWNYLEHIYTSDQPETFDMIYQFRTVVDDYTATHSGDARVLMTEAYTDIKNTMLYYGTSDGSTLGAHFTFNFFLITDLNEKSTARDVVDSINKWYAYLPVQYTPNWVLGNHDQHRVASRLGVENVDGFNMLVALLPGVQVTYNGEEIGMEDGEVTFDQGADPSACKDPDHFDEISRDFERTPFHWDKTKNAGFSDGDSTWLPVSSKYLETNLADESIEGVQSHYHVYQDLAALRKEPTFEKGKLKIVAASDNVIAFTRSLEGYDTYVYIFNMGDSSETVSLKELFGLKNIKYQVSVVSSNGSSKKGLTYNTFNVVLDPHESVVIKILEAEQDWWKHAIFYQVYPRSFKDSDGDGVGDLKGITSKVQHFKDTGVNAVWLSPIYKSPQVDQGYDISDYRQIHDEYGTMEDFEELLQKAHTLGIKIFMDLVPNHCSNQHEWFTLSEDRAEGYEDYFVWKDPVDGKEPNNWISLFKDSAWTYSEKRGQYYLHQFAEQQPDLNYRSEAVVKEMKEIMLFWLDKGVDGFRVDAVPYLFEDEEFKDEPPSGNDVDENDYEYLKHVYTSDQPETFDMIYQFRTLVDQYTDEHGGDSRVLMTEAYTDIDNTMLYYGTSDGSKLGAHFAFNFFLITDLDEKSTAQNVADVIENWNSHLPEQYTPNWVLGNHDRHRVATRFGPKNADGFNMLAALLPGVQVTYNGEEIGMEDGEVTYEQGADPSACKDPDHFDEISRDFERTPYHWDRTKNAGFSDADATWLPVSEKYLETNLADESVEGVESHYHVYQELAALRQKEPFANGKLKVAAITDNVFALVRYLEEEDAHVFVFNRGDEEEQVDLSGAFEEVTPSVQALITSVGASIRAGTVYSATEFIIGAHEAFVGVVTESSPDPTTTTSTTTTTTTAAPTTGAISTTTEAQGSGNSLLGAFVLVVISIILNAKIA